jgi:hypothetical protein
MDIIPHFIAAISGCLLFAFPGLLFTRALKEQSAIFNITVCIFISIGFWICCAYYISWSGLPLKGSYLAMQLFFIGLFLFLKLKKAKGHPSQSLFSGFKKMRLHHHLLLAVLALYALPLFFITIPPGCDSAMHGYVTRLIINNNGLPHSYRPILPVDSFGSYSSGYHIITALASFVDEAFIRQAINFITIASYPIAVLASVFFFMQFFSERTVVYTGLVAFCVSNTIHGSINWGGTPTVLAFGFCLFSAGLLVHAVQKKSRLAFLVAALSIAAIPLVHLIPAVAFAYLAIPGYLLLLYKFKEQRNWILTNTFIVLVLVALLLLPFLLHFENESSAELTKLIKHWQIEMMGNKLTGNLGENLLSTLGQIKYRLGDTLVILCGASLAFAIYFKQGKKVLLLLIFMLCAYLLIFNYGYWLLPLSELLYPERVVFFMIFLVSFLFGFFLSALESKNISLAVSNKRLSVFTLVAFIAFAVSSAKVVGNYTSPLLSGKRREGDKRALPAYEWINKNTEKNAVFVASYNDVGMWVPAFTNRATIGTHLHFIHLVKHVEDTLASMAAPRYYFVTAEDSLQKKPILDNIKNKAPVFTSAYVRIYR